MRKICTIILGALLLTQLCFARQSKVPFETVKQFADSRASVIWGNVYPDVPLPLYSIQDELIGYSCNYSIGQPFPVRQTLMQQCAGAATGSGNSDRWMAGSFGSMLVSATTATSPLVRYSKVVSDEYAYGEEIEALAKAKFNGKDCQLYRVYIMNILAKWYCFKAGEEKVYVKVFPPVEVYTEDEFKSVALAKYDKPGLWKLPTDINNEWQQYFDGKPLAPLVDHLIPNEGIYVPFYDWSFGCTPTAFSMALAYWDNQGMTSANDYGNLVKYHLQRWDGGQSETDKNVPDLQRSLAIAMNTDSIGGGTGPCCWLSGFISATNARGYGFSGADLYGTTAQYWAWAQTEINAGRTFHMGTPGHSSTGVGYNDASQVIVHNTWWGTNDYFNVSSCDLVGTIIPGGQYGAAVNVTKPFGDPRYSDLATLPNQGEDLYAGDAYEITWDYDYLASSWVRLSYSVDAGTPWTIITSNTPNDGSYIWRLSAGVPASTLGRIRVEVLDASGVEASDGSYGNFDFHSGGSLYNLAEDSYVSTSTDPDFFQFTNTAGYWNVVGVRPNISIDDWDISLYDDANFTTYLAGSSYSGSTVDFVVVDGNHSPTAARGIKANRYSGTGSGRIEWEGGADIVMVNSPINETWTTGDVVEMWDAYLAPGYYKCTMLINSGTADMGMALFGSSGVPYYAGRPSYLAMADSYSAGADESFWVTITTADYYGLCIFAKDANPASITVKFETQGQWLGMVSSDWFDPDNWSAAFVPTAAIDVTINTGYAYYPVISSGAGNCNNITIGVGAKLSLGAGDLNVAGNMTIYGQVEQTNSAADFNVTGSIFWESGSTANITAGGRFSLNGDWEFRTGATANLTLGSVYFEGSSAYSYIRNYAVGCSFNNVYANKASGQVWCSSSSADTLNINGYLYINTDDIFYSNTNYPIVLKGQFYNYGHLLCPYGTFIFDGTTHSVNLNTGDYFNNIILSSSGNVTLADSLRVHGDLTINSGSLVAGAYPVFAGGNWNNMVGTSGFAEGTGKVVFNGGNYHQYCSGETFNILEVDKSLGGSFRLNGTAVTCQNYDWTAGSVDVLSGIFTANDLSDNAIAGNFYLNPGGTINLYNTDGWVDLNGNLFIYGGNFNVYGGNGSDSYWPYTSNAGITMSDGILDIKNVGVYVYNSGSYILSENITGGTIRTSRGFAVSRADYTADAGTLEFYGPTDGGFYTLNGGYVHDVVVNKSAVDGSSTAGDPLIRDRETHAVTDAPLTNTVSLAGDATVSGNFTLQSGVVVANSNTIYVGGDWNNLVGTTGFIEGTGTVEFNGALAADVLTTETFYNLNLNKSYPAFDGLELMQDINVNNDVHLIDGSMELNNPADLAIVGNLTMDMDAGLNANDTHAPQVSVGKNWTNANTGYTTEHGFDPGYYSTVIFNGATDQYLTTACVQETFYNLIVNKSAFKFRTNDNLTAFGDVEITNGIWEDGVFGLYHKINGNFTVQPSGALYNAAFQNTIEFTGSQNSMLTYSSGTGYFHNLFINKGVGTSVTQFGNTSCQNTGNLTVENGIYNLNGYYLWVFGDVLVNDAGVLSVPGSSTLVLADTKSLNVNSGGRIDLIGTSVNPTNIRANVSTARFALNINSGGTIAAEYAVFKNTGANGVYVSPSGIVDLAHSFRGCTFQDGAAGGTLLALNNAQVLTIRNAVFPTNTWGGNSNVAKTLGTGHVYFVDFSGGFSGETYDADGFNLIDWVPTLTATATATPAAICSGSSTQLNVIRAGGLPGFTYLWSPATGLSNPAIINPIATPASTTTYYCTVTDALGTTVTASVVVTINPYLPVSVSITASANPSPPGNFVLFTATPVNGGSSPSYQWRVNGANVGTGLPTYSYVPSYNDQVYCIVTSNYACPTGNPAASNIITMIIVPVSTTVTGTVPSPLHLCFDASNTVTVAGGGTSFVVASGARVDLIAGVKISILYGASVQSGGYLHGYITTTNSYCGSLPPAMVAVVSGVAGIQQEPLPESPGFILYPNPASGSFTLMNKGDAIDGNIQVEIFNMQGGKILSTSYSAERTHLISLPGLPPGLCFVKVLAGNKVETFKLIVTR